MKIAVVCANGRVGRPTVQQMVFAGRIYHIDDSDPDK